MAKCGYCGSMILFGGVTAGGRRFCNAQCAQSGQWLQVAAQIPADVVEKQVWEVHQGLCPVCKGRGPVDIHMGYQVWSALVLTSWKNTQRLSCRSCGIKHQLSNLAFSLVAGWWGFPLGLIMTPVQIFRNIAGMVGGPDPMKPSDKLESVVRMHLGQRALAARPA
jgi:hypothetical protein